MPSVDARADEPETRSSRGDRRRSAMSSSVKSRKAAAAVRRHRLLLGRVELVHLHHRVRPVEEVAMVVGRHSQPLADEPDPVRLGEVVEKVHASLLEERIEQLLGETRCRLAHCLDAARREGGGYELADACVIGRLGPQETPALHVPERLPARVERLCAEFLVAADVTVVPAEPSIAEARANVGVARHEPTVETVVPRPASPRAALPGWDTGLRGTRVRSGRTRLATRVSRRTPAGRTHRGRRAPRLPSTGRRCRGRDRPSRALPHLRSSETLARTRARRASASATTASAAATGIANPA